MRRIFVMLLSVAVVLTTTLWGYAEVKPGDLAPDFTVKDTQDKEFSLSDYKGKFVVLEWFNPDCPFVRKHYDSGNMQRLQKKYTVQGVVWLSINSSAPGKQGHYSAAEINQLMQEKDTASTAIVLDGNGTIGRLYGAKTTPHIFILDPKGVLIYQGAIDDTASTDVMDIPKAVNYLEAAFDRAMSGKPVETAATASYGCSVKY